MTGYLIFAVSAALLFQFTQQDPHASPSAAFAVGSVLWGMLFAASGGFTAAKIARRPSLLPGFLVGGLIATGAIASLLLQGGQGSIWSQLAAVLLMAPAAVAGNWIRRRKPS
jgi:fructose-specific phosphotransferase system IIC component